MNNEFAMFVGAHLKVHITSHAFPHVDQLLEQNCDIAAESSCFQQSLRVLSLTPFLPLPLFLSLYKCLYFIFKTLTLSRTSGCVARALQSKYRVKSIIQRSYLSQQSTASLAVSPNALANKISSTLLIRFAPLSRNQN